MLLSQIINTNDPAIWKHRSNLSVTRERIATGKLTVGFIGGSITDPRPRHNWPEPVIAWLGERYPQVQLVVENAAIGATGSDLAVFRAKRDLIDRGCDLVFVEYAVNDEDVPTDRRNGSREGLLRQLLRGERDVVLLYTYSEKMYDAMMAGEMPATIREFEDLAEHYGIGSVWMGLYALNEVRLGRMRFEEWLPDGLHPTSRGSLSYAHSVMHFLEQELDRTLVTEWVAKRELAMQQPLQSLHWEQVVEVPLASVNTVGPWALRRWPYYTWVDQVLETAAIGATLSFFFAGRGLALVFDFGKASAEFRWRLDGGEWHTEQRERPDWLGADGWLRLSLLGDSFNPGAHHFELEVIHGYTPGQTGTNLRLAKIGVIL